MIVGISLNSGTSLVRVNLSLLLFFDDHLVELGHRRGTKAVGEVTVSSPALHLSELAASDVLQRSVVSFRVQGRNTEGFDDLSVDFTETDIFAWGNWIVVIIVRRRRNETIHLTLLIHWLSLEISL